MKVRHSLRAVAAATALAGGLLAVAGPASAATIAKISNYTPIAPGATTSMRLVCPSYAPTMLLDTVAFTPKAGVTVTGTSLDTSSDAFHRHILTITAQNGSAAWSGLTALATCTS
ncbi:hypothetical protein ACWEN6_21430 [Sphaerisporangium sp. NPDC004334]